MFYSADEEAINEMNNFLQESLEQKSIKLSLDMKIRLVEILNTQENALTEFLLFTCKRVIQFSKIDCYLKPIYDFMSHIFTHFSKTGDKNNENFEQLV